MILHEPITFCNRLYLHRGQVSNRHRSYMQHIVSQNTAVTPPRRQAPTAPTVYIPMETLNR